MRKLIFLFYLISFQLLGATITPPSLETTQTANTVLAGPTSGGAAISSFRSLVTADFSTNVVTSAKIGSGAATNGQVLTADGAGNSTFQSVASGSPTGAASGDLQGTYPSPSLNGTINTNPSFSNGIKINTHQISAASKPGAPLNGDLWLDTTTNVLWIFSSTFNAFVSTNDYRFEIDLNALGISSTTSFNLPIIQQGVYSIVLLDYSWSAKASVTGSGGNHWAFGFLLQNTAGNTFPINPTNSGDTLNTWVSHTSGAGSTIYDTTSTYTSAQIQFVTTGSPGTLQGGAEVRYKLVHP